MNKVDKRRKHNSPPRKTDNQHPKGGKGKKEGKGKGEQMARESDVKNGPTSKSMGKGLAADGTTQTEGAMAKAARTGISAQ
jgi:hypothetical protein